jgi:hypothetical protein
MTTSGGKDRGASRSRSLLKPRDAFLEEPLTPHADDFARGIQYDRDFIIIEPLGSKENHLGSHYHKKR